MDLKLALQDGTHALYCKPSQKCLSKEVLSLRRELATVILLNVHSVKLLSVRLKAEPQLSLTFGMEREAPFQNPLPWELPWSVLQLWESPTSSDPLPREGQDHSYSLFRLTPRKGTCALGFVWSPPPSLPLAVLSLATWEYGIN